MKTKQENQKNQNSKKFNLEKQEVLKLDTMRKIYGGQGENVTLTIKTQKVSTAICTN